MYNDSTWMGLALFACVAVEANPTAILDIQNSETSYSHSLVCHLDTSIEDLKLLQQGGFIWIPVLKISSCYRDCGPDEFGEP